MILDRLMAKTKEGESQPEGWERPMASKWRGDCRG